MRSKRELRAKRKLRIKMKVHGTKQRPRMSIFRSGKKLYVQLIDDDKGTTMASFYINGKNMELAKTLGQKVGENLKIKKISRVVFDRGGYRYHGAVKEFVDAVRKGGIQC
ncbi:50S ribosomal protein L18 [Patescibacteria group bacterium]|nr:50S ribosomal protein L18 [Patescibacteria group bacterium]MBU1472289.1 50S ribosomal protein L18 [Patescibacteria group bacterium]MBU2460460.1 50S ribosomal protein L18 [Patescibacteria group bacterium]MBU2543995.1 50S ribosomal protein L18 [Patescibacteria group bacterium]